MARKPGSDERQEDFFGRPAPVPEAPKRPARSRPATGAAPGRGDGAPPGEDGPGDDGIEVQLARLLPSELRALAATLSDEALARFTLAAIRQLRRRLERNSRRGHTSRASVLERAAQELIAELAEPGDEDF